MISIIILVILFIVAEYFLILYSAKKKGFIIRKETYQVPRQGCPYIVYKIVYTVNGVFKKASYSIEVSKNDFDKAKYGDIITITTDNKGKQTVDIISST